MVTLPITLATASVLGLIFVVLSALTIRARVKTNTSLGIGESVAMGQEATASPLLIASRTQANFAEYVPLSLILLALLEGWGVNDSFLVAVAVLLVLSRLLHVIGMNRSTPNPFRGGAIILQFLLIASMAVYGLMLAV